MNEKKIFLIPTILIDVAIVSLAMLAMYSLVNVLCRGVNPLWLLSIVAFIVAFKWLPELLRRLKYLFLKIKLNKSNVIFLVAYIGVIFTGIVAWVIYSSILFF